MHGLVMSGAPDEAEPETGPSPRESGWKGPEGQKWSAAPGNATCGVTHRPLAAAQIWKESQVPPLSRKRGVLDEDQTERAPAVLTSWGSGVRTCRAGPRALTAVRAARGG